MIGEAVTQTFQSLSDQITDQVLNEQPASQTTTTAQTTTTETTTTTTETRDNEIQSHTSSRSVDGVTLPQVFETFMNNHENVVF